MGHFIFKIHDQSCYYYVTSNSAMKKLLLILLLFSYTGISFAQTKSEIIQRAKQELLKTVELTYGPDEFWNCLYETYSLPEEKVKNLTKQCFEKYWDYLEFKDNGLGLMQKIVGEETLALWVGNYAQDCMNKGYNEEQCQCYIFSMLFDFQLKFISGGVFGVHEGYIDEYNNCFNK